MIFELSFLSFTSILKEDPNLDMTCSVYGETIIVDDFGSADFNSIQSAINHTKPGGTIVVKPGIYYENLTIIKTINLIGSGANLTIIYGEKVTAVVHIEAEFCNISGFTITGLFSYSCLLLQGNYTNIKDCECIGNVIGITIGDSNYNNIENCSCFQNSGAGMFLGSSNYNRITNSSCLNCTYGNGIYISNSFKNSFTNGVSTGNGGDGFYAYWLSFGTIIKNYSCSYNSGNGIYILDSDQFEISNTICEGNMVNGFIISSLDNSLINCSSYSNQGDGFGFYHSENSIFSACKSYLNKKKGFSIKYSIKNEISNCAVISNSELGIWLDSNSKYNKIFSNNFINNNNNGTGQALDCGSHNKWSRMGRGNYWWDYSYFYNNASNDGIVWDVPYGLAEANNPTDASDDAPLIHPVGPIDEMEDMMPGIFDDTDSDKVFDFIDVFPDNGTEWMDTDGDGTGNNADSDDDNDGLTDVDEVELGTNPLLSDTDGDNFNDGIDLAPLDPKIREEEKKGDNDGSEGSLPWDFFRHSLVIMILIIIIISILIKIKRSTK